MLPRRDGLEVLAALRRQGISTPVLLLTAKDAVESRVAGLDDGADDYLVKPFAFPELSARIRTLLRRDAARSGAVMHVGDIEVDTARHHAQRGNRTIDLTAKEFAVLRYF